MAAIREVDFPLAESVSMRTAYKYSTQLDDDT